MFLLLFSTAAATQTGCRRSHEAAGAERLFRYLAAGDYGQATLMFHLPEPYSEEEISRDREVIAKSLAILEEEFGRLEAFRPAGTPTLFFQIGVGGGEGAYWARFPVKKMVVYEARFSRVKVGYLKLRLCDIGERWVLQSVEYGIPMTTPGARQKVNRIFGRLLSVVNPSAPGPKALPDSGGDRT
ncbi:MAG: hypothetical protein ACRENB_16060 [Gemmatimonadales bacterium]